MKAIEGLARLIDAGEFSSSQSWEERIEEYEGFADPIRDFSRRCLERDPGSFIVTSDLKAAYDRFAAAKHHEGKSHKVVLNQIQKDTSLPFRKDRSSKYTEGSDNDVVLQDVRFRRSAVEHFVAAGARELYEPMLDSDGGEADDEEDGEAGGEDDGGGSGAVDLGDVAGEVYQELVASNEEYRERGIPKEEFEEALEARFDEHGIEMSAARALGKLHAAGDVYEPVSGRYRRV